jgi:hypothetical protein
MSEAVQGLLVSQIGYESGRPKRAVIRGASRDFVPEGALLEIRDALTGARVSSASVEYWGALWRSHWWVADFSGVDREGIYEALLTSEGRVVLRDGPVRIAPDLLYARTWRPVALEQLQRRVIFATDRKGWADCGATLREANSHAVMVIGLCDLLERAPDTLPAADCDELVAQVRRGGDYLAECQDLAQAEHLGDGAVAHEYTHQHRVIPGDVAKCAVAWARAAQVLKEGHARAAEQYAQRAQRALHWLGTCPLPVPDNFHPWAHGAPENTTPPAEFMTRDLVTTAWAHWELHKTGRGGSLERAAALTDRIIGRQRTEEHAEDGLYGQFRSFDSLPFTEKAWEHHGVGHDCGATFPHYLIYLIEMYRAMPDHPRAQAWRECLERFAFGYFIPACSRNPFLLLPQGVFGEQGLLQFGGLWHGSHGAYAHAAALAVELGALFGGSEFAAIATGNVQWIAGLNAGVTRESLAASHVWSDDIPEGVAEARSMILGIGNRWAGSWRTIRGSICNGFDPDQQFRFDVPPTRDNDGPFMFTDEDWIVHAGAWLSAISRLSRHV